MRTRVVNIKNEQCDVYIGRGSKWGNPFKMKNNSLEERHRVISEYYQWILEQKHLLDELDELDGKKLGCYCAPELCHGDVLVYLLKNKKANNGKIVLEDYLNPLNK